MYVLDFGGSWDMYLPLAEFSYNNSYHASIDRPPFEMLYKRKCRTPIYWDEVGQRVMGSTKVVLKTTEKIQQVRRRLQTTQSRQKSYADKHRLSHPKTGTAETFGVDYVMSSITTYAV